MRPKILFTSDQSTKKDNQNTQYAENSPRALNNIQSNQTLLQQTSGQPSPNLLPEITVKEFSQQAKTNKDLLSVRVINSGLKGRI